MAANRVEAVTLAVRDLILSGEIEAGARLAEISLAERLGVSRTPVRLALQVLEGEGLVIPASNRGYLVRRVTVHDVLAGFDVRGTLEGFAARIVAEAGLKRSDEAALLEILEDGDALCATGSFDEANWQRWADLNVLFHRTIINAADNAPLAAAHELVCRQLLVGPAAIAYSAHRLKEGLSTISESQAHHRAIVTALQKGEGARVEFLAREHIYHARESMRTYLKTQAVNPSTERSARNAAPVA